jgi:hypothetical protein
MGDGTIKTAHQILAEEDRIENELLKRNNFYQPRSYSNNNDTPNYSDNNNQGNSQNSSNSLNFGTNNNNNSHNRTTSIPQNLSWRSNNQRNVNDNNNQYINDNNNNLNRQKNQQSNRQGPQVRSTELEFLKSPEPEHDEKFVANVFCDSNDLLKDMVGAKKTAKSPLLFLQVQDINVMALLDTGSEISCISDTLYEKFKRQEVKINEFPVNSTVLRGAFGNPSRKVTSQLYLTMKIVGQCTNAVFVVVKGLVNEMIIGIDVLQELSADINLQKRQIQFVINQKTITANLHQQHTTHEQVKIVNMITATDEEDYSSETTNIAFQKKLENVLSPLTYLFWYIFTLVRHPQANPVKRIMRELSRLCRAYCQGNHKILANHVPHFARLFNVAEDESTSCTPYKVRFGKPPATKIRRVLKLPVDPREDNATAKAASRKAKAKALAHQFQPGNLVLLKVNNISSGPYEICKRIQPDVYILIQPSTRKERGTFHVSNLKPCFG